MQSLQIHTPAHLKNDTTSYSELCPRANIQNHIPQKTVTPDYLGLGGELLSTCQRHQRDLFSGDLGIPEIKSHDDSVIHTFTRFAILSPSKQSTFNGTSLRGTVSKNKESSGTCKYSQPQHTQQYSDLLRHDINQDYRRTQFEPKTNSRKKRIRSQAFQSKELSGELIVNNTFKDNFAPYSDSEDYNVKKENLKKFPYSRKGPAPLPPTPWSQSKTGEPKQVIPTSKEPENKPTSMSIICDRIIKETISKNNSTILAKQSKLNTQRNYNKVLDTRDILESNINWNYNYQNNFLRGTEISHSFIKSPLKSIIAEKEQHSHPHTSKVFEKRVNINKLLLQNVKHELRKRCQQRNFDTNIDNSASTVSNRSNQPLYSDNIYVQLKPKLSHDFSMLLNKHSSNSMNKSSKAQRPMNVAEI